MQLYCIPRRSAWRSPEELQDAAAISTRVGEEMAEDVRWIRSYVLDEPDGSVGIVCFYQATSPEALHEHARRVGMPADEVIPVAETVLVRADPQPATAS